MMKRLTAAALLLAAVAVPMYVGAASRFPTWNAGGNWADATWSAADDNARNQAAPTAADTAYLTGSSGALITVAADAVCGPLDMASGGGGGNGAFTGTLSLSAGKTLTATSVVLDGWLAGTGTLCLTSNVVVTAGTAVPSSLTVSLAPTSAAPGLTCNSTAISTLRIDAAGGVPTCADMLICTSLTIASGTLDVNGQAIAMPAGSRIAGSGEIRNAAASAVTIAEEGVSAVGCTGIHRDAGATDTGTGTGT